METIAAVPWVEKFNLSIRGIVVLAFTFGVIYGFTVSKVLSTETFVVLAGVVYTWWFKSRDEKGADGKATTNSPTPPAVVTP